MTQVLKHKTIPTTLKEVPVYPWLIFNALGIIAVSIWTVILYRRSSRSAQGRRRDGMISVPIILIILLGIIIGRAYFEGVADQSKWPDLFWLILLVVNMSLESVIQNKLAEADSPETSGLSQEA